MAIVIFCFQAKKYTKIKTLSRGWEVKSQKEKSPTMKIAENKARIYLELFFLRVLKKIKKYFFVRLLSINGKNWDVVCLTLIENGIKASLLFRLEKVLFRIPVFYSL